MTTARPITPGLAGCPSHVDVLVIGLGVTGAGVALDAASRGLSVLAVDAHDLAFGTSRFSSKLVHGGLRYLAEGQIAVAHQSAVERAILLQTTAPHLTHPMPSVLPLGHCVTPVRGALAHSGLLAGDLLRRAARTPSDVLPAPRRIGVDEALRLTPGLRSDGLRGALLSWDGQLEDDARLVATIARTATQHGAVVHTHARVLDAGDGVVTVRDELRGQTQRISARAIINATGVWAGGLVPEVRLRPSRGTHLVLRDTSLPGLDASVFAPVPGELNRFVLVLGQPDRTIYVGLTDEPVVGPTPTVAQPTEVEIGFLLDVLANTFTQRIDRSQVVAAFAGLRPLLDSGNAQTDTADLSRRHAVLTSGRGVTTVVGGKLTTYRAMAEDAVDAAIVQARLVADPCRTRSLPLSGAAGRAELAAAIAAAATPGEARLLRRFGSDAPAVLASAVATSGRSEADLLAPVASGVEVTAAELLFGVTHEGAANVADLLDRRTRVGLIDYDRKQVVPAAQQALELAARSMAAGWRE